MKPPYTLMFHLLVSFIAVQASIGPETIIIKVTPTIKEGITHWLNRIAHHVLCWRSITLHNNQSNGDICDSFNIGWSHRFCFFKYKDGKLGFYVPLQDNCSFAHKTIPQDEDYTWYPLSSLPLTLETTTQTLTVKPSFIDFIL